MCTWLPVPAEPKLSLPGWDFARLISSFRFLAGTPGLTTTSIGPLATLVIKVKSLAL